MLIMTELDSSTFFHAQSRIQTTSFSNAMSLHFAHVFVNVNCRTCKRGSQINARGSQIKARGSQIKARTLATPFIRTSDHKMQVNALLKNYVSTPCYVNKFRSCSYTEGCLYIVTKSHYCSVDGRHNPMFREWSKRVIRESGPQI